MYTSEQLAQVIEGTLVGSREVPITGFAPADKATEGDITFLAFPRYLPAIRKSRAGCVIVGAEIRDLEKTQIVVKHPYYAFVQVVQLFEGGAVQPSPGISHSNSMYSTSGFRDWSAQATSTSPQFPSVPSGTDGQPEL